MNENYYLYEYENLGRKFIPKIVQDSLETATNNENVLKNIISFDESWDCGDDHKTKQQF